MPVQLLPYTPVYCLIGIYRLVTGRSFLCGFGKQDLKKDVGLAALDVDHSLWHPIWLNSEKAAKKAALISSIWVSWRL